MRKYILLLLGFLLFQNFLIAQEFEKAPIPKVKSIIEWIKLPNQKEAQKGKVYSFNPQGLLTQYKEDGGKFPDDMGNQGIYKYDKKGRIISKKIQYGFTNTNSKFEYTNKYVLEEVKFKDSRYRNYIYSNKKGQKIEYKSFISNYDTDYKFQLFERTVYTYSKSGKLIKEKHFKHWNVRNKKAKPDVKNITYKYYPKNGKLKLVQEYDYNGKLNTETNYTYNNKGKLTAQSTDFLNGEMETLTLKYQKGKLWTEVFEDGNIVITKIYKNNRMIRKRTKWGSGKEDIIDFQYQF